MADVKLGHQTVQESPKAVTLSIVGEADSHNGPVIERYFDQILDAEKPRHILLDLSGVTFASTDFFSFLVYSREELTKKGGMLVLFGLRSDLASTMRIFTLDRVLTICPDQQAALAALPKG